MVTTNIAHLFSLAHQMNVKPGHPYRYSVSTAEGVNGFALVRNSIAQQFMKSGADILWMIDDDIAPQPDAFGLLLADADIVAPLMPMLQYNMDCQKRGLVFVEEYVAFRFGDLSDMATKQYAKPVPGTGVVEVDAVGFGCVVIQGKVLKDERLLESGRFERPDGKVYDLVQDEPPPLFHYRTMPNGACALSEDVDFCLRAKRLGYTVKVDTSIEVGHKKTLDILPLLMIKRHLEELNTSVAPVMA